MTHHNIIFFVHTGLLAILGVTTFYLLISSHYHDVRAYFRRIKFIRELPKTNNIEIEAHLGEAIAHVKIAKLMLEKKGDPHE